MKMPESGKRRGDTTSVAVMVRLSPELLELVDDLATRERRTRSNAVSCIVAKHFERGKEPAPAPAAPKLRGKS